MDMREAILTQADQIRRSLDVNRDARVEGTFDAIVLAGMGGSGHPGDLVNALHLATVPLSVHRDYDLPRIHAKQPLVIASTYSGNTEETLSAYQVAKKAGYQLMVNTSGGTLREWSERDGVPLITIDFPGMQPRHTLFASFVGIATALKNSGLAEDVTDDLRRVADVLDQVVPTQEAEAQQLAAALKGKTPVYTSSALLSFAAKNFKIQTNENVKTPAFWNEFPELNHNEMVGFTHPQAKFHVVMLRDTGDHPRTKARLEVTTELYRQWGIEVTHVDVKGETLLEKLFYAVSFGLWTTYYLAQAYGIDPVPVEGVENFKKRLVEVAGEAV
jgi:glucose/mannose-6-phosphate isomerase